MQEYSITSGQSSSADIRSLDQLQNWIKGRSEAYKTYLDEIYGDHTFDPAKIGGIQYVSKTLSYDLTEGFVQRGNGPNYFGGLYTLATCRHDIRGTTERTGGWNFDEHFESIGGNTDLWLPKYPVLVVNSTGKISDGHQRGRWVASIAFVTHAFRTMEGYADFLLSKYGGETVTHRLTRAEDAPEKAIEHGDCHANYRRVTGGPPDGHPHHEGTEKTCGCDPGDDKLHRDNDDDHLKVLSMEDFWLSFDEPVFENTIDGRGHGKIESWDLENITEVQK